MPVTEDAAAMYGPILGNKRVSLAARKAIAALIADLREARVIACPSELEMHRSDYQSCKDAGWESPGELLSAYKTLEAKLAEAQAHKFFCLTELRRVEELMLSEVGLGLVDKRIFTLDESDALDAAISKSVDQYKIDAERWCNLKPHYTAAVFDPESEDGLNLGKGTALVFMLPEGFRVSANADATIDAIAAQEKP